MNRKKAFVDFDGTLSRGYISIDFMDYLFQKGFYNKESYAAQQQALQDYKKSIIGYDSWCEQWGMLWAEGMKGQDAKKIKVASNDFFLKFKKNIYPSSYGIIGFLQRNYDVSMISVGASEVICLAAKNLGIEKVYSTTLEMNEKYTGRLLTDMHLSGAKERFLKKEAVFIGLGDSFGDIGFLKLAKVPIAMNPDQRMRMFAEGNKWLILDSTENTDRLISAVKSRIHE